MISLDGGELAVHTDGARMCPGLEKDYEIVAGRFRFLMVNVHELAFNLNKQMFAGKNEKE